MNSSINLKNQHPRFEFTLKGIALFTKEGQLILKTLTDTLLDDEVLLFKLAKSTTLFSLFEKSFKHNFLFHQIIIDNEKIEVLDVEKSNTMFIGVFSKNTKNSIIKLFLLHVAVSFFNYVGEKSKFTSGNNYNVSYDNVRSKIYQKFLFTPLRYHFENVSQTLFKRNELLLSNIKYKNFYLVDLDSDKILFKLSSMTKKKKVVHFPNNVPLWNELLFHGHNLREKYKERYFSRLDPIEYQDYFARVEYTSTYPRLTFMIKFLPILKGMALIHVYSQNKLSRSESDGNKLPYKEFDYLYGNELNKDSNHMESKYREPKLLKEIESFFIEFFFISHAFDFFNYPKIEKKYFDAKIIKIIEDSLTKENIDNSEEIFKKVTLNLYEEYLSMKKKEQENKEFISPDEINLNINFENKNSCGNDSTIKNDMMISNYQWGYILAKNSGNGLFQMSKHFALTTLFSDLSKNPDINKDDVTINLTKYEDKSFLTTNTNGNQADKISELIKKDFSGIPTQQRKRGSQSKMPANNIENESISLFNLDITAIKNADTNSNKKELRIKSKSQVLINKIRDKLKERDSGNLNTNTIVSFGGEENNDFRIYGRRETSNEYEENELSEYKNSASETGRPMLTP